MATSKDEQFGIHNVSRSRHNRTLRAAGVARGLKQYIGGTHRLIRGQVLVLTAEQIELHLKELQEKEAAGLIEVRTLDGRKLSLNEPGRPVAPAVPASPAPHPVLDSIANDTQNVGNRVPQFPGGDAHMDEDPNIVPDLVKAAEVEEPPVVESFSIETAEPVVTEEQPHHKKKKGSNR